MIKVMGLAHKDIKIANINTFKDLMGNISLMRRGIKDFFLNWAFRNETMPEMENFIGRA